MFKIDELKEGYRTFGGPRFIAIWGGTVGFIGISAWLMMTASWPTSCAPEKQGRSLWRLVEALWCSPDLLSGGAYEIALFACLWLLPAILVVAILWRVFWELRRRR